MQVARRTDLARPMPARPLPLRREMPLSPATRKPPAPAKLVARSPASHARTDTVLLTETIVHRILLGPGRNLHVSLGGGAPTARTGLFVERVDAAGPCAGKLAVGDQIAAV